MLVSKVLVKRRWSVSICKNFGAINAARMTEDDGVALQVERPEQLKEIVPQKRLADKVSGILSRIEAELDAVDEKIGERMHILDLDNDGLVSAFSVALLLALPFMHFNAGDAEGSMLQSSCAAGYSASGLALLNCNTSSTGCC